MITFYKRLLIAALVLIGLAALMSGASATETRVGSMGGIGFYTHDNSNIFFFPGAVYSYGGQVIGEFRIKAVKNQYTVGVNYPFEDKYVIGAYLNRPIVVSIPVDLVGNLPDNTTHIALDHTTDVFYGAPMGNYNLGLRLSVGLDSWSNDITTVTPVAQEKQSAYYFSLGAGLSNATTDLAVNLELPHAKGEFDSLKNTWSGFGFGLNARKFYGDRTKIVPLVVFAYRGTNAKAEPGAGKIDFTDMTLGLGLGVNHNINENNLLVMAIEPFGYAYSKSKIDLGTETKNTVITMPGLYMGLESSIKTWLTGRIGVAQVFQSTKTSVTPNGGTEAKTTTRSAPYNVTFGMGFHFGDFVVDAGVNEGLFFDGPNFISGSTNAMATRLSATYQF